MTGEGSEYGGKHREIDEDETERVVREIIDEVRKEIEEREASETQEEQEEVKSAEDCVREAIEEIRQEEEERQRALEEWEERQREKEEQLEESREERAESADKDDFAELEERILENFDDYDIDPEEVKERWQERFEEDVKEQLDGSQNESEKVDGEDDEQAGDEGRTAEGEVYYTDSSGQVHVEKIESDETAESKAEPSTEVQEQSEESAEMPEPPESQEPETKIQEGEVIPSDEQSSQTQEGAVEHPHVREHEEENEEIEKQSLEIEPKEVAPEREKTDEKADNPYPETESSLDVDETVNGQEPQERHEQRGEESDEQVDSFPEIDTEHHPTEEHEHQESEESSEADTLTEESKEELESSEEEIWTSYELDHSSLEDENWKQYLREVFNKISEEEKEAFKEYLREQVETIEDFEELLRKYGLEELLDEEDVMEEVRQFLEFKHALEANPEKSVEDIAEELGLDVEQALEWSRGESEPLSLKKLLNLEAYYLWDQVIRSYREREYPKTREELEQALAEHSELRNSRFLSIEQEEALAWIEITGMRRRGKIKRIVRNGREIYYRKQIMELSEKYGIAVHEIIKWLRGETAPSLIEKIGKVAGTHQRKISHPKEIDLDEVHRMYFIEGRSLREIAQRVRVDRHTLGKIFREQGWETSRTAAMKQMKQIAVAAKNTHVKGIPKRRKIKPIEVYQLYCIDGLTLKETAERLGLKTTRPIRRILKDHRWTIRSHDRIDFDELYRLHLESNLSLGKIAKATGLTASTIRKAFKERGLKARYILEKREVPNIDRVYELYYEKGLTKEEVAEELNASESSIRKVFKEMGWPSRIRKFDSKAKRRAAKEESKKEIAGRIVELRERLFGAVCRICGVSSKQRTLIIHKKDGVEHKKDILWRARFLRSVNPEQYAALCPECHPGVHWMMNTFNVDYEQIKRISELNRARGVEEKLPYQIDTSMQNSDRYLEIKQNKMDKDVDIRRLLFGETCFLCGVHHSKKTLIIHRKDGRQHNPNLTRNEKNLSKLNPDEWISLCQRCHRETHWAMNKLGVCWEDLERMRLAK